MELFREFISEYGSTILYAVVTAAAGYLGVVVKRLYTRIINDRTKQDLAKTVVSAVEQIYKDLHGEEKLKKAVEALSEMLGDRGINITELELRMLIESAVAEFNRAFESGSEEEAGKSGLAAAS